MTGPCGKSSSFLKPMTENEQRFLLLLGEHADTVIALINGGVFEMKNGSIELHFDGNGRLRKLEKRQTFIVGLT